MRASIRLGNDRLLNLADELEEIEAAEEQEDHTLKGYEQSNVVHPCGSPACAWGHYVLNGNQDRYERLIKETREDRNDIVTYRVAGKGSETYKDVQFPELSQVQNEFALTPTDEDRIFEWNGCNHAATGKEAAQYIRGFVAARKSMMGEDQS